MSDTSSPTDADWMTRQTLADVEQDDIQHKAALERARREAEEARAEQARADAWQAEQQEAARQRRREARAQRFAEAAPWLRMLSLRVAFVAAMSITTGAAIFSQYSYAHAEIQVPQLPAWFTSAGVALALESIALVMQGLAIRALIRHDAWLGKQLAAYGIAVAVGGLQYFHWTDDLTEPTTLAVTFALASVASPVLWGMYARDRHRDELHAAGQVDPKSPKFSAARKLFHPVWSLRVLSWSSWHGHHLKTAEEAVTGWEAAGRPTVVRHVARCQLCTFGQADSGQADTTADSALSPLPADTPDTGHAERTPAASGHPDRTGGQRPAVTTPVPSPRTPDTRTASDRTGQADTGHSGHRTADNPDTGHADTAAPAADTAPSPGQADTADTGQRRLSVVTGTGQDSTQTIADAIEALGPDATQQAIADRTGLSVRTVRRRMPDAVRMLSDRTGQADTGQVTDRAAVVQHMARVLTDSGHADNPDTGQEDTKAVTGQEAAV